MRILITGATGFVGRSLVERLLQAGHEINVLTRNIESAEKCLTSTSHIQFFEWNNQRELPPAQALSQIDGVINLMGENIAAKRWSTDQKEKLRLSRVEATKNLILQIENVVSKPLDFFISSSAIGIYPTNTSETFNENSRKGHSFLATLCLDWENTLNLLTKTKRKVIIRTSVVLEKHDGALKKMLPPFMMGVGGPIGDGNQIMSWIHLDDLVALIIKATSDERFTGAINAASPSPVNNFDFTKSLGRAIGRPTLLPVPSIALKIMFGEMSSVILDSQAVVSSRLNDLDFQFQYPTIDSALQAIFKKS